MSTREIYKTKLSEKLPSNIYFQKTSKSIVAEAISEKYSIKTRTFAKSAYVCGLSGHG